MSLATHHALQFTWDLAPPGLNLAERAAHYGRSPEQQVAYEAEFLLQDSKLRSRASFVSVLTFLTHDHRRSQPTKFGVLCGLVPNSGVADHFFRKHVECDFQTATDIARDRQLLLRPCRVLAAVPELERRGAPCNFSQIASMEHDFARVRGVFDMGLEAEATSMLSDWKLAISKWNATSQ